MSTGNAYPATTPYRGLSNIIVHCDADKLVIINNINPYKTIIRGDPAVPQFSIDWSNVSKLSVDHLLLGYNSSSPNDKSSTRSYHFDLVDTANLPSPLPEVLGPARKFIFSITDQRQGTSLLFDALKLGCLGKMRRNGSVGNGSGSIGSNASGRVYAWEILENPVLGNVSRVRALGTSIDYDRMHQTLQDNLDCHLRFTPSVQ